MSSPQISMIPLRHSREEIDRVFASGIEPAPCRSGYAGVSLQF